MRLTHQNRSYSARPQTGAVLVETAIALPLLLLMVFGGLALSLLLVDQFTLHDAVRDATRAAVLDQGGSDLCAVSPSAVLTRYQQVAEASLQNTLSNTPIEATSNTWVETEAVKLGATVTGVKITAHADLRCPFCNTLLGHTTVFSVQSSTVAPLEPFEGCMPTLGL